MQIIKPQYNTIYYSPIIVAKKNKIDDIKCWSGCGTLDTSGSLEVGATTLKTI